MSKLHDNSVFLLKLEIKTWIQLENYYQLLSYLISDVTRFWTVFHICNSAFFLRLSNYMHCTHNVTTLDLSSKSSFCLQFLSSLILFYALVTICWGGHLKNNGKLYICFLFQYLYAKRFIKSILFFWIIFHIWNI